MNESSAICIIGQILVDVTLPNDGQPIKMRLGGIMHAARTLWALDCPYVLAYIAPDYLDAQIRHFAIHHGAVATLKLGSVTGSPNVILIPEPKEAGPQGYEMLLRDEHRVTLRDDAANDLLISRCNDYLIFPGGFALKPVLSVLATTRARVYADANFKPYRPSDFRFLKRPFESLILSTSSSPFLKRYRGDADAFRREIVGTYARSGMIKENRGGTRLFVEGRSQPITAPAHVRPIQHSVGVGDCFDAAFAFLRRFHNQRTALSYASMLAAEYASTTYPDDFRTACEGVMAIPAAEVISLRGVCLPWEQRPQHQIYVAAPDFDYVERAPLQQLCDALRYHNFRPRLPVREHGQINRKTSARRRQETWSADMGLLAECDVLVAVLLYDDPGTLIEIGLASAAGKPVIVFDPYERAENLMLTHLPRFVAADLDQVITAVFESVSEVNNAKT